LPAHAAALGETSQMRIAQRRRGLVAELPVPKAGQQPVREPGRLRLGFWSADWTPWPAILRLRQDWPALRFEVRPRYDDAG
jgi:hypothetical protein